MVRATLSPVPLWPFGAELSGDELGSLSKDQLKALLVEHDLLVARQLELDLDRQISILSNFGNVLLTKDGIGMVSIDPEVGGLGTVDLNFHSDMYYAATPYDVLSLYGADVNPGETSTLFANSAIALASLPKELRQRAEAANVRNTFMGKTAHQDLGDPANPNILRPLVAVDGLSGKSFLAANQSHSRAIEEPADDASLLDELFAILYAPDTVLEHFWSPGDLVIWNNATVQHGRRNIAGVTRRTLQRVAVGRMSAYELLPLDPDTFRRGHPGAITPAATNAA